MKVTYNVAKVDAHRKGRDGLPVGTIGAIVYYDDEKWFVDLELHEDREKFDKFVAETVDDDKKAWEDTFYTMFSVEDVDDEWYRYYVNGVCINDKA